LLQLAKTSSRHTQINQYFFIVFYFCLKDKGNNSFFANYLGETFIFICQITFETAKNFSFVTNL
jgi:hypothetical protein